LSKRHLSKHGITKLHTVVGIVWLIITLSVTAVVTFALTLLRFIAVVREYIHRLELCVYTS
jgi:hypothetical protein